MVFNESGSFSDWRTDVRKCRWVVVYCEKWEWWAQITDKGVRAEVRRDSETDSDSEQAKGEYKIGKKHENKSDRKINLKGISRTKSALKYQRLDSVKDAVRYRAINKGWEVKFDGKLNAQTNHATFTN